MLFTVIWMGLDRARRVDILPGVSAAIVRRDVEDLIRRGGYPFLPKAGALMVRPATVLEAEWRQQFWKALDAGAIDADPRNAVRASRMHQVFRARLWQGYWVDPQDVLVRPAPFPPVRK